MGLQTGGTPSPKPPTGKPLSLPQLASCLPAEGPVPSALASRNPIWEGELAQGHGSSVSKLTSNSTGLSVAWAEWGSNGTLIPRSRADARVCPLERFL